MNKSDTAQAGTEIPDAPLKVVGFLRIRTEAQARCVRRNCRMMKCGRPLPPGMLRDADLEAKDFLRARKLDRVKAALKGVGGVTAKIREKVVGPRQSAPVRRGWLNRFLGKRTVQA